MSAARAARISIAVIIAIIVGSCIGVYVHNHIAAPPPAPTTYSVGLGVEFNTHATPIWIALNKNLFSKYGLHVSKVLKFKTGLELAAAFARGEVQAGWACLGPALMIIAKGVPIKIVAKVHNYGYALVVNPRKVKSIKDLNGKVVYAPGKGSPCYLLLLKIEKKYGVKFAAIKFMKPPTALAALLSGEIEAAAIPEPYCSVAQYKGLKVLVRASDVWPDMPGSFLVVTESLLKKHPDVVKKLVEVTDAGIRILKSNMTYAAQVDSKVLGIPFKVALQSIRHLQWNTTISIKAIQQYINFMYEHGILKKKLNASDIVVVVKP